MNGYPANAVVTGVRPSRGTKAVSGEHSGSPGYDPDPKSNRSKGMS